MDRNVDSVDHADYTLNVALLAEGVDRNTPAAGPGCDPRKSPSSRRAWIEIEKIAAIESGEYVALLAEGVDRNSDDKVIDALYCVALLAEGVDRNRKE